jgi:3-oxoacyl-[acyl-carrier protein] reductase
MSMPRLQDKVALVTGASRGIGAAIAARLAADGAKVVVNYSRSEGPASALVETIKKAGGVAIAVKADLSNVEDVRPLFDATIKQFGRLDILVNNAAISERRPVDTSDAAHYAKHFDLNVRGVLLATAEAVKHLKSGGRIINITSGIVRARVPHSAVYAGSKAAVEAMTRSHSAELGPRGITVNCVAPGVTETDMLRGSITPAVQQVMIAQTALGRLGQPNDIADVVAFIASDDSRWITGEVIGANGGLG